MHCLDKSESSGAVNKHHEPHHVSIQDMSNAKDQGGAKANQLLPPFVICYA